MYMYLTDQLKRTNVLPSQLPPLPPAPSQTLKLVYKLCQTLRTEGIDYCHWKSNNALDRSANGDNDLDLLISRADAERFTAILHTLGFKEAQGDPEWQMPGILDYFGYDNTADRFVHVHVHYQLVIGEDMTKNYHLPLESAYLASATQGALFRTPSPEFELIVFVLRMIIKHSTWDTILGGWGALSKSERQELIDLQATADRRHVNTLLVQHLPNIDIVFFQRCEDALQPQCPIWKRISVGRQLQQRLQADARRGQIIDVCLRFWRRGQLAYRRRFAQMPRKRFCNGGALIAVVGGDGAGKSTTIEMIQQWLAPDFEITQVHLGKPPWSRTTKFVRALLKLGRRLTSTPYVEWADVLYEGQTNVTGFASYCLALRALCVARDLYWTYRDARRDATNGSLVICDRFPLPQITWMEAPQIEYLLASQKSNWLLRLLSRLEKQYFQGILPPELLFVLRLDPEIAVQRRSGESPVPVLVRNQGIWQVDWAQTAAHVMDASCPQSQVHAEIKSIIWSNL